MTTALEPETGREVAESGRLCAQAEYHNGSQPWTYSAVSSLSFEADMAELADSFGAAVELNLNYLMYGHTALASVSGLGNLRNVHGLWYTFTGCSALTQLDFRGFDPSTLETVAYAFSTCSQLTTILADSTWFLPEACAVAQTFYGCSALVGGAGTVWDSGLVSGVYMRIDDPDGAGAGYLTVG